MTTATHRPNIRETLAQKRRIWLTHAIEQAITNVLYAVLVGAICVVLFS